MKEDKLEKVGEFPEAGGNKEIKYKRFAFAIEIPSQDIEKNLIDTHRIQDALYRQFGWAKGDVRLLVAEIEHPKEFELFKSKGLIPQ